MEFALELGSPVVPSDEVLRLVDEPFLVRVQDMTLPLKDACPALPWEPDPHLPGGFVLPLAALTGVLCHGSRASQEVQDLPVPSVALLPAAAHRILSHLVTSGLSLQDPFVSADALITSVRLAAEAAGDCQQLLLHRSDFFSTQRFQDAAAPAQQPQGQGGRGNGRGRGRANHNALQVAPQAPPPDAAADATLDFVRHLKIGTLTDASGLLAPLGDLLIALGRYITAESRVEGTQFHSVMSDLKGKQPSDVTRDSLLGGMVAHWWTGAMWPQALRNTVFQDLHNQLDISARGRFTDRTQKITVLTERFSILLKSTPSISAICSGMLPAEAYALLNPMCKQLVPLADETSIDQFFELDKIVSQWILTVDGMLDLTTPREKVQWIVEKVKMLNKANKLLPTPSSTASTKWTRSKKGPPPIADKVHASVMGQMITSQDFIELWSATQPQLELIRSGFIEDSLDDTLSQVLGMCFCNHPEGGPILWVVQWLVSELSALPYHMFFTEMLVVRNKKAVYLGNAVARDAAGLPLEGAAGFVVTNDIVEKMDNGEFHLIHFYNDLLLPLRSYVNQSREAAIEPTRLWKETEIMREILPIGSNLFQAYGFGSAAKDNSFGSLVEKVIGFIQGAATPMKQYHVQKVSSNMPRIMKAAGETFLEAMHSPPTALFPSSFLNPVTHAAHLEDLRINTEAAKQMTTLSRAFPGLMHHLAAAAVDPSAAFIPQTGLVTKFNTRGPSKAPQRDRSAASSSRTQGKGAGGGKGKGTAQQRTPYAPGRSNQPYGQANQPYVSGRQGVPSKKQKPSTPDDYLGLAAHIVTENQSTLTLTSSKPGGKANKYSKTEMARHLKCKVEDRCWAVGVSLKPHPQNLMFCNNKSHRPDDPAHQFPNGFSQLVQKAPFWQP